VFGWNLPFSRLPAPVEATAECFTGPPSSTWLRLVVPTFASLVVARVVVLMFVHRLQYVAEVVQRRWLMRQFPWSYASATCGGRRASSLLAVNRRRDGWKRRPVIGQRALGLCCAIPNMSRVFSVKV
jgi:H+/Cl- antiporter ClcA